MAKESKISIDLAYVTGTQMQSDITGILHALKAREARLLLKDMYDQKMISVLDYEAGLKKIANWVGLSI